jgi:hypothetical protein
MAPPIPVPAAPHYFQYCEAFNTSAKLWTLLILDVACQLIYGAMFILGVANIWNILVTQKYYRSVNLSLQYLFGQCVCICRICSCIYFLVVVSSA